MAGVVDILPSEYGYVVLVLCFSFIVLGWMGVQVMNARKKYDVKYPTMYSDKHDMFNCVQRAHQNTLEIIGYFMAFMLLGGLQHPRVAAIGGFVWLMGRISYARGYYTGDPEKRLNGGYGYIGLFAIIGSTISLALHLLGVL